MILDDVFIFHEAAAAAPELAAALAKMRKMFFQRNCAFRSYFADSRTSHIHNVVFSQAVCRAPVHDRETYENCNCMSRRRLFDGRQQQPRTFFWASQFLLSAHFVLNIHCVVRSPMLFFLRISTVLHNNLLVILIKFQFRWMPIRDLLTSHAQWPAFRTS